MRPPRVLLLEAGGPEFTEIVATAAAAGYQIHAVTTADVYGTYSPDLKNRLSGCLLTDLSHPDRARDEIIGYARRVDADAVLTTNEYLTDVLAHVCAGLDLLGNDPARAHAARNKAAMAQALSDHGVTAPRSHVAEHEHELRRLINDGYVAIPCVVKPADAAGSAGVTVVRHLAETADAWRAARAPRGMYAMPVDSRVLLQNYIVGTEYSVESLTQNGRIRHLCIARKHVTSGPFRTETGHSLPATVPPAVRQNIYQQVERALAAVGIRDSASHTEVMISLDGQCTVIETAARLGAGHIGVLIHHAFGISPWTALLDTALGQPADITPTRRRHSAIRFLTSHTTGRLVSVHGLPQPSRQVPAVQLRRSVGDRVSPPYSNRERLGHFIVTGEDATAVERLADDLLSRIVIKVEREPDAHPAQAEA